MCLGYMFLTDGTEEVLVMIYLAVTASFLCVFGCDFK